MKKGKMNLAWIVAGIILLPLVLLLLFLALMTMIYIKQPLYETSLVLNKVSQEIPGKREFSLITWNIGYGGLGKDMDFFYEGGKRVRPEEGEFKKYFLGIKSFLKARDSVDFIFLQEADIYAKRSYYTDEASEISHGLPSYCYVAAKNYDCRFVPLPLTAPMGRVVSGIVTFSKFNPVKAEQIGFGTTFSWPKQVFFLQRCFIVFRIRLENGKELVLINTHNSTFDAGGTLRKQELAKLQEYALPEFSKGNYVIAGGDWNNNPVGFVKEKIKTGDGVKKIDPLIPASFLQGWRFAYDLSKPTNRDVDGPYRKGLTKTTIIDFFILSPNIDLASVNTLNTGFEYSDHQPVIIKINLK